MTGTCNGLPTCLAHAHHQDGSRHAKALPDDGSQSSAVCPKGLCDPFAHATSATRDRYIGSLQPDRFCQAGSEPNLLLTMTCVHKWSGRLCSCPPTLHLHTCTSIGTRRTACLEDFNLQAALMLHLTKQVPVRGKSASAFCLPSCVAWLPVYAARQP